MAVIELKTDIPGPKSQELLQRLDATVARSMTPGVPLVVARARGAVIEDVDGNRLIDFAGGLGALNTGHAHPKITERIQQQAANFIHTDFSLLPYEVYIRLAEALAERTPVRGKRQVAFFNSGAEAVENAVKIARKATGRRGIICFEGAFHGRTLMALSLTSRVDPYKKGFGPFAPDVHRLPYANPFTHKGAQDVAEASLSTLERAFSTRFSADEIAAIIVEPVQGEGGFVVPPPAFLQGLRALADRHGIVLIADEIQTGYGRTGRFFALEHFGVEADLVTVGKSIAAGLPLSAVVGSQDLVDAVGPGGLGGTTIGNPVACAAGLAVLEVIEEEGLIERAHDIGNALRVRLEELARENPMIGDIRGLGAMIGAEIVTADSRQEPAQGAAGRCLQAMVARGLIAATAGVYNQVVRFLPPLVTRDVEIEEAGEVIEKSFLAALNCDGVSSTP